MKRFICGLLLLITLVTVFPLESFARTYAPPFDVNAESVYMANLDSNMIIYEKDAEKEVSCDALSRLMTLVMAIENIEDPENTYITMRGYIQDEMSTAANKYGRIPLGGLYKGETLSALDLMYASAIQNACEASYMLSDYMGDGSEAYFVKLMNHRAKELGMENTHFANSTGLPDEKAHTTAYDMYILARHAMELPLFEELVSARSYYGKSDRQEEILWTTYNKFMQRSSDFYNPAMTLIKEGSDPETGISSGIVIGKKNGYTYVISLMNCRDPSGDKGENRLEFYEESSRLLSWAVSTFKVKTLLEQGKSFQEVPLRLCSGKDYLRLMSAHDFAALIPDEIEASSVQFNLKLPSYVEAPVKKGDLIGEAELILSGEVIGRVAIVSSEDAKASSLLIVLDNLKNLVRGYGFKLAVCFITVSIIFYIIYTILNNRSRTRYRRRR